MAKIKAKLFGDTRRTEYTKAFTAAAILVIAGIYASTLLPSVQSLVHSSF